MARQLEQHLSNIVDKLHILICLVRFCDLGLATETVELAKALQEGNIAGKLYIGCVSQALVSVLEERIQPQHIPLLDILVECVLGRCAGAVNYISGHQGIRGIPEYPRHCEEAA